MAGRLSQTTAFTGVVNADGNAFNWLELNVALPNKNILLTSTGSTNNATCRVQYADSATAGTQTGTVLHSSPATTIVSTTGGTSIVNITGISPNYRYVRVIADTIGASNVLTGSLVEGI